MLHPLLYTSPRLSPLRPYTNAVLARMIRHDNNYQFTVARWYVQPPKDTAGGESATEKKDIVDGDPRMVFGETEFQTMREKYQMPKHVHPKIVSEVTIRLSSYAMVYWVLIH
jgi:hypothetical protein